MKNNLLLFFIVVIACVVNGALLADELLTDWYWSETAPPLTVAAGALSGTPVKIPHTINATDIQDGGGKDQMSKDGYRRAPAWYAVDLPQLPADKRIFVRFGAVAAVAEVYLNGKKIGEHRAPATAFALELTEHLNQDGDNRLAVMADNTWRNDVAPLSGDFAIPNGIYRPVELLIKPQVCFDVTNPNCNRGVCVLEQAVVSDNEAKIVAMMLPAPILPNCKSNIKNMSWRILAANGEEVAAKVTTEHTGVTTITINDPHLWNGLADPYLYTVQAILTADDGAQDTQEFKIGFRKVEITPEGTLLNGKPYPLRGVNRHQDRENCYWAVTPAQEREDVEWIKKIGANTVRAAHYPHSEAFLNACDEAGILVWAELPLIDTVGDNPDALLANLQTQLTEMIAQQRHHPSVFCWSLYNEIGHRPGKNKTDATRIITALNKLAKQLDPTRYTAAGANKRERDWCAIPDIMAYNGYPGWYGGGNGEQTDLMKTWRQIVSDKAWGISEYGAGASIKHQDDTISKPPKADGKWHPEAWQTRVHEAALTSILADPKIWGTYVWNMFDFASPWRSEGDRDGINDKGLVTYDRQTPKDAFFLYKANWNPEPLLYLLARRDKQRQQAATVIRYYTNQDNNQVTLTLNGEKIDAASAKNYAPNAWIIENVKLQKGKNIITATATTADGKVLNDEVEWWLTK